MLTPRQHELLQFIGGYVKQRGSSPNFGEMAVAMNLKSKAGIVRMLDALEDRGFVRRLPNRARSVEILRLHAYEDGRRVFFAPGETIKLEGRKGSVAWVTDGETARARIERKDARIAELERKLADTLGACKRLGERATAAEAERDLFKDGFQAAEEYTVLSYEQDDARPEDKAELQREMAELRKRIEKARAALRPAKGGRE